jgi:hypothetical protein
MPDPNLPRPIQTYTGRGVAKTAVTKNHHAIIFTGKEPRRTKDEKPGKDELGMRPSVRVNALKKTDKLDPMSRINYAKIYTVEHNVKVYDFGQVDPQYEHILISNFNDVWFSNNPKGAPPAANLTMTTPQEETEPGEEGEEDEEDEDDDAEEGN